MWVVLLIGGVVLFLAITRDKLIDTRGNNSHSDSANYYNSTSPFFLVNNDSSNESGYGGNDYNDSNYDSFDSGGFGGDFGGGGDSSGS